MAAATNSSTTQVRIQLTTRDAEIAFPEETGPLLVSTGFRRVQLSILVNDLLETEKPIPFDFLVNGQYIRTSSIDQFLTANGISAETTLNVEYVRALLPPLHAASFEHDDWVSSVDVLSSTSPAGTWSVESGVVEGQEIILSGSYDGLLRAWSTSCQLLATSPSQDSGGHSMHVKRARFLSPSKIASCSFDRTIRIWNFAPPASTIDASAASIAPTLELYGHRESVEHISVHAPTSRILSASADRTVGLWSASKSSSPAAPPELLANAYTAKRRKTANPAKQVPQRGPLSLLTGHAQVVSSAVFAPNDPTVAYSASWDHALKTWDLTTGACVDTRTAAHPLLSLAALQSVSLVAAGTTARHITLIDPRANATSVSAMTLRGHTNAVASLSACPGRDFVLVSGGFDGDCRVWDIRNVRPGGGGGDAGGAQMGSSVYRIGRESKEGGKVFDVVWDSGVGIVSGGEDRRVQVNRSGEIGKA